MKNSLFLIAFFTFSLLGAQPTAEKLYDGVFPKKPENADRMDRWMLDFGHSRLSSVPAGIKLKPWSRVFVVNRFIDIPFDKKSRFGIAIGGGFSFQHLHSNGQLTYVIDSLGKESTTLTPLPSNYQYRVNKLALQYVELPFQLRFRSGNKHNFFFYPGFKAAYLFGSLTKLVDRQTKIKVYRIRGFDEIQYGATLHIGYNRLALWGYYAFSNLFKVNRGFDTQIMSIGISLNFF